ncbi:hypothetical protein [Collimonas arenae]|uniref:hypothetical protein n=1 Tax=Collimonas arenae TaxID=279058 RepID=UPI000FE146B9|nr:hypothetical protein [Collimonas arenae]
MTISNYHQFLHYKETTGNSVIFATWLSFKTINNNQKLQYQLGFPALSQGKHKKKLPRQYNIRSGNIPYQKQNYRYALLQNSHNLFPQTVICNSTYRLPSTFLPNRR